MKPWKYVYSLLIMSFVSFACGSPVYVEKAEGVDLSDYNTYMWIDTRKNENDNGTRATAYADISVHNAANAELRKQGWREVSSDPDVLVMYDVLVENTSRQESDPVYSQPMVRYFYNPYRRRWVPLYYPSQFVGYDVYERPVKEGTITITIVDADTDKTVWQGWTTEDLSNSRITSEEIDRSVKNIFSKFDVAMR